VRIIGKREIVKFMTRHAASRSALQAWVEIAENAQWQNTQDIKSDFASASFIGGSRVIFNIGGNNYRLAVQAVLVRQTLIVIWVGTHAEYSKLKF